MIRLTDVVKNLLILNIGLFVLVYIDQATGGALGEGLAALIAPGFPRTGNGPIYLADLLALHYPTSDKFEPIQLVTHFFMHGGMAHIFFNMFALAMFGPPLEAQWGARRFLLFYFICAFGAAALHLGYNYYDFSQLQNAIEAFAANPSAVGFAEYFDDVPVKSLTMDNGEPVSSVTRSLERALSNSANPATVGDAVSLMEDWRELKMDVPVVGASGAIYGLLLAFGMYYPNMKLMLIFLPVPVKAKYFIPVLMLIELFLGFQRYSWDNMAHFAHLGGALTGLLMILYWRRFGNPWQRP